MTKHTHGEAFKLMAYATEDRALTEIIWNSRDGVSPFVIGSRDNPSVRLSHVDWQNDEYRPLYQPPEGMRIFVDYSLGEYQDCLLKKRVEPFWDDPEHGPRLQALGDSPMAVAERLAKHEWQPGSPRLVTVGKDGSLATLLMMNRRAS